MALIKFGLIVTAGSGSLGGHTIQHSKGGFQLRNKPVPKRPPSQEQSFIRSINKTLQSSWYSLTANQRLTWNNYAKSNPVFSKSSDSKPLSGHSIWLKYQFEYLFNGFSAQLNPFLASVSPLGPELVPDPNFLNPSLWTLYGITFISYGVCFGGPTIWRIADISISPVVIGLNYRVKLKFKGPFLGTNINIQNPNNYFITGFTFGKYFVTGPEIIHDGLAFASCTILGLKQEAPRNGFNITFCSIRQIL